MLVVKVSAAHWPISLKLTPTWEEDVRKLLHDEQDRPDPETERKEIRSMLRLMRDNFERGLYEGEEYQYWQKVSGLKEKLALLERVPEPALNRLGESPTGLRTALLYPGWDAPGCRQAILDRTIGGV
jgi:hypothetical protein